MVGGRWSVVGGRWQVAEGVGRAIRETLFSIQYWAFPPSTAAIASYKTLLLHSHASIILWKSTRWSSQVIHFLIILWKSSRCSSQVIHFLIISEKGKHHQPVRGIWFPFYLLIKTPIISQLSFPRIRFPSWIPLEFSFFSPCFPSHFPTNHSTPTSSPGLWSSNIPRNPVRKFN